MKLSGSNGRKANQKRAWPHKAEASFHVTDNFHVLSDILDHLCRYWCQTTGREAANYNHNADDMTAKPKSDVELGELATQEKSSTDIKADQYDCLPCRLTGNHSLSQTHNILVTDPSCRRFYIHRPGSLCLLFREDPISEE